MKDVICFNCGGKGHFARSCVARNRRAVNNILEEADEDNSALQSTEYTSSNDDSEEEAVAAVDLSINKKRNTKKYVHRIYGGVDKSVSAWEQYIQEQGDKPRNPIKNVASNVCKDYY